MRQALFSAKMTFLRFLGHVIDLLRSSYVPQAFFSAKSDSHMALAICGGRGLMKAHCLRELAFINGSGFG